MNNQLLEKESARNALFALLLLVPAPSLGLLAVLVWFPDTSGRAIFGLSKLWLFVFPAVWTIGVDREYWRLPAWPRSGLGVGMLSGIVIFLSIIGGYALLGQHWVNVEHIRSVASSVGLNRPVAYLGAAVYWCLINSLLEEYVWRWFVYRKCETILPGWRGVLLSGIFFTLHHIIALNAYFDLRITVIGAFGVLVGGVTWSGCYLKFRSVWPGWSSHVWADVAVFGVGYHLFFKLSG